MDRIRVTAQDLEETFDDLSEQMVRLDTAMKADPFSVTIKAQPIEPGPRNPSLEDLRLQCQELQKTVFEQSDLLNKKRRQNAALRALLKSMFDFQARLKSDAERIMEDNK